MANSVECLLEVNEVVVKVAMVHLAWVAGQAYGPAVPTLSEASLLW